MDRTFPGEDAFRAFAQSFARTLRAGDIVGLSGPLGAGKTTFVKAVVSALHGEDAASSPTFTFWHRYDGDPPIDHIDLYRIDDERSVPDLGLDDAYDGSSIVLVEWWEHAGSALPAPTHVVRIAGKGDDPRTVSVTP